MRITIQAILKTVDDVKEKDTLKYQYVLMEKPIRDNFSGELIFIDYYPATIFNENIDKCKAKEFEGQKIEAACYLNSQLIEKKDSKFYNLRLKITSIKALPSPKK